MAYHKGYAQILRDLLRNTGGISECKMGGMIDISEELWQMRPFECVAAFTGEFIGQMPSK